MNEIIIALLILANVLLIIIMVTSSNKNNHITNLEKQIKNTTDSLLDQIRDMRTGLEGILNFSSQSNTEKINSLMISQNQSLQQFSTQISNLTKNTNERLERIILVISNELDKLVKNNEQKLNEMRQTVDEKLNSTLEKRLNASFNLISNRLEAVYTGLGEMKNLASGVGELKNVLTNV